MGSDRAAPVDPAGAGARPGLGFRRSPGRHRRLGRGRPAVTSPPVRRAWRVSPVGSPSRGTAGAAPAGTPNPSPIRFFHFDLTGRIPVRAAGRRHIRGFTSILLAGSGQRGGGGGPAEARHQRSRRLGTRPTTHTPAARPDSGDGVDSGGGGGGERRGPRGFDQHSVVTDGT